MSSVTFTVDILVEGKIRHTMEGYDIATLQEMKLKDFLQHVTVMEFFDIKEFDLAIRLIEE